MGLAEAMEREERARSHPEGEREREKEGNEERHTEMEIVGGRNRGESEAVGSFFLEDLVSVAQWSFSFSGKTFSPSVFTSPSILP